VKRHGLDPFSLGFGALFLLIAVVFLAARPDPNGLGVARLWPVPVIGLGALMVILAVRAGLREQSNRSNGEPGGQSEVVPKP
jgi:hypothetical protein